MAGGLTNRVNLNKLAQIQWCSGPAPMGAGPLAPRPTAGTLVPPAAYRALSQNPDLGPQTLVETALVTLKLNNAVVHAGRPATAEPSGGNGPGLSAYETGPGLHRHHGARAVPRTPLREITAMPAPPTGQGPPPNRTPGAGRFRSAARPV